MQLETIAAMDLASVHGGDNKPPPHYNSGDLKEGVKDGALGALRGGPLGGVVGFGWGFMKRNVGELYDASKDLYREYRRGQELDKRRK
ncbi:MAG: hypothetical protein ABI867_35935 [Kofleriaceae bacterium]